jgi:hypothetical protein
MRLTWTRFPRLIIVCILALSASGGVIASSSLANASVKTQSATETVHKGYYQSGKDPYIICFGSQCLNNWNGIKASFNPVKFYQDPAGRINDQWGFHNAGKVVGCCDGSVGPFTNGSGMNSRYNNDIVYQIGWFDNGNDSGYDLNAANYDPSTHNGDLAIAPTTYGGTWQNIPTDELYVETSYGFLVSVYATNLEYHINGTAHIPVWLGGKNGYGNGDPVSISNSSANSWSVTSV